MREEAPTGPSIGRRQIVKFTFFKVDPAWRGLPPEEREPGKEELCRTVEAFGQRLLIRSYTLMGMRGDADFLLWQIGDRLEDIQELTPRLFSTTMGPYLTIPYSYLAMTRRSIYTVRDEATGAEARTIIVPSSFRYLFVYPFVKTRAWYKLSKQARQEMMDHHIAIGRKYPSVKLNTTYSYGLDDQEFVVAFETDNPADFLDLVMELRDTEASIYTLRDTPIFTCIAMPLRETLDSLGAVGETVIKTAPQDQRPEIGWVRVGELAELPPGSAKVVYLGGDEVALFNVAGRLYAIDNRCSHANGPLYEGQVQGTVVTCPWHGSQFDLVTGQPSRPPAHRPLRVHPIRVDNGSVYLASPSLAEAREES